MVKTWKLISKKKSLISIAYETEQGPTRLSIDVDHGIISLGDSSDPRVELPVEFLTKLAKEIPKIIKACSEAEEGGN